ncbi:RDAC family protein [Anaerosporobacter faecicola]|uniref:RDAC family protein n=1 Tax=Anaerosporobacter faecicola TaxID=2718714 RepID=UPI001EE58364|nr:hypothetical protein [Anaerosporobacter faecicola]
MKIIGFQEIMELNRLLDEKGLHFKIHLRDACGRQSMWIEPLGNCACEGRYEEMYQELEQYFQSNGYSIAYSEDRLNLWIVN